MLNKMNNTEKAMNEQEYEYFDGEGQISQGNEEFFNSITWVRSKSKSGERLMPIEYRRPINYFTKEYQAELAKQWVLEGGFDREAANSKDCKWFPVVAKDRWYEHVFYRRKQTPPQTQEELDAKKVKEISDNTFKNVTEWNHIEKAILEAIKYGRQTK